MPVDGAIIGLLFSVFWVWMLIDCLFNKSLHDSKISWALFIVFTQTIGALIYFFFKCKNRNPFDAAASYYKTVVQWAQPTASTPPNTPYYTPNPQRPVQPLQHDYQEGYAAYQYQPPQQQAIVPISQLPNAQQTTDEQYEQPMISYPEMP